MNIINLTPTHYIGLLYLSFAHRTDGVFSKNEQTSIWKSLKKWMPDYSDNSSFSKTMDEIIKWYKQLQQKENFEENLKEIASRLNEYNWFTDEKKEESLKDLRNIALSDKQFLDTEKKWMRDIAKLWNIDKSVINKLVK